MTVAEDLVTIADGGFAPWGRCASAVLALDAARVALVGTADVVLGSNVADEPVDGVRVLDGAPVLDVAADAVRQRWAVLRAAAMAGAARGAYRLTRDYVRERRQFGGPLLDIPAVATAMATMKVQLVQADAAVTRACAVQDADAGRVAVVVTDGAATEIARIAHQLHGAMGVTAEYPLHQVTRRIWAWRDFPLPSNDVAGELGAAVLARGERYLWSELTAWCPVE